MAENQPDAALSAFATANAMDAAKAKEQSSAKASEEEAKSAELDEDTKKSKARSDEQAFLMLNWQEICKKSSDNSDRFTQFAQMVHDNPAAINNLLFKKEPKCDIILKATSANLSYFTPKIRLFKEYIDSDNSVRSIEFPIILDYTEQDFRTMFETNSGRGGGVGLKSFNWTTIGNSSGNMYSFGADIELFFESIEELTRIRRLDASLSKDGKPIETSFSDLILQQLKNTPAGAYNPNYYRIKALIGWNTPSRAKKDLLNSEFIEEMADSNMSLYLGLHSHEINFADDSSITLKLKYIAYVEAFMQSPSDSNIFYSTDSAYVTNIGTKKQEYENLTFQYTNSPTTDLEKRLKNLENDIKQLEAESLEKIYSRILSHIYQGKTPSGASVIKYSIIDEQAFDRFTTSVVNSFDSTISADKINAYNASNQSLKNKVIDVGNVSLPISSAAKADTPKSVDDVKKDIQETLEYYEEKLLSLPAAQTAAATAAKNSGTVNPSYKVIPYFYLGDLLEAVLIGMYGANKTVAEKELKVVLGPLRFYDYGSLVSIGEALNRPKAVIDTSGKPIQYYTGKSEIINIADIPISLSAYSNWFLKNIVDNGVVNMTFREFINLILNDLVLRATSIDTYSFAPRQRTRLVYKTKVLSMLESTRFPKNDKGYRYNASERQGVFFHDPNEYYNAEEKKKLENILFIYGTVDNPWELKSEYEQDIKKGIRHLYYGTESGMVKKINFKRVDNQLLRSHNIKLVSSQAADKSILLREVYNADIEMFGNNVFEIGELVYVSPTLFGTSKTGQNHKDREVFAKSLGIGGYYMILKINSSISDASYDTQLTLQWVARGDGLVNDVLDTTDGSGVKII